MVPPRPLLYPQGWVIEENPLPVRATPLGFLDSELMLFKRWREFVLALRGNFIFNPMGARHVGLLAAFFHYIDGPVPPLMHRDKFADIAGRPDP